MNMKANPCNKSAKAFSFGIFLVNKQHVTVNRDNLLPQTFVKVNAVCLADFILLNRAQKSRNVSISSRKPRAGEVEY